MRILGHNATRLICALIIGTCIAGVLAILFAVMATVYPVGRVALWYGEVAGVLLALRLLLALFERRA